MRRIVILLSAVTLLAFTAAPAFGKATTLTIHYDETLIEDTESPCQPAMGPAFVNAVFHETIAANGSGHFTVTETGTFFVESLEGGALPVGVLIEGRYTFWAGGNFSPNNSVFTFTLSVKGTATTNGSTSPVQISMTGHGDDPDLTNGFLQWNCHDGTGVQRIDF